MRKQFKALGFSTDRIIIEELQFQSVQFTVPLISNFLDIKKPTLL
jgi:hypothetical protein